MYRDNIVASSSSLVFHGSATGKTVFLKQCHSKGNISEGGGGGTRAPEARVARGVWGHAPPENFVIYAYPKLFFRTLSQQTNAHGEYNT